MKKWWPFKVWAQTQNIKGKYGPILMKMDQKSPFWADTIN